jgi:DNA-directed RNA polymerase specialized sigma24 family protein
MTRPPTQRQLPTPIQAHDVNDLEALVRRALNDELHHRRSHLNPADYEDALAYLIADAAFLAQRYDPTRARPGAGKTTNFATWCYRITRRRYTSWLRWRHRHDERTGPAPQFVSLDLEHHPDGTDGGPVRLAEAIPTKQGDPATDRSPDLARALDPRSSQDSRLLNWKMPTPTRPAS